MKVSELKSLLDDFGDHLTALVVVEENDDEVVYEIESVDVIGVITDDEGVSALTITVTPR